MKNSKVLIIEGDFKNKIGIIIDVYEGWNFQQYIIVLDDTKEIIVCYHNEVEILEKSKLN